MQLIYWVTQDEPGESISDCDKDEEDESMDGCSKDDDEDESEDGFFVPDGYLSDDEVSTYYSTISSVLVSLVSIFMYF